LHEGETIVAIKVVTASRMMGGQFFQELKSGSESRGEAGVTMTLVQGIGDHFLEVNVFGLGVAIMEAHARSAGQTGGGTLPEPAGEGAYATWAAKFSTPFAQIDGFLSNPSG
jgi:hypothetical protein